MSNLDGTNPLYPRPLIGKRAGRGGAAGGASRRAAAGTKLSWLELLRARLADRRLRRPLDAYVIALVATGMSLLVRIALGHLVDESGPFLFFAPAVMISAWYGGWGPGLLATILGAVAGDYFLLVPSGAFSNTPADVAKVVVFLLVGAQISWLSGALFSAKSRAEADAKAARRSEQLYRTLAQHFPNGAVFLLDRRLRFALAEGSALGAVGAMGENLRGMRLSAAFPRTLRRSLSPLLRTATATQAATGEVRFAGRVYLVRVLPLRGIAGQSFAGMAIAQDITELAAVREALQATNNDLEARVRQRTAELQLQKTLLEAQSNASLDGILVASDESQVIFHNRRLAELWRLGDEAFGGSLDEAVGAMRGQLVDPQNPLRDADGPGLRGEAELPANLVLQDGRTLECYSAPVRSGQGRSYGKVWYFRDITERRQLARQILEAGERERQRIGQDLHDDLCQHLTGITCLGRVLQQRLTAKLPAEAEAAGRIVDLVEQAVRRARDLARGLQPMELQTAGLAASLRELASNVEGMFQVRCHFHCDEPVSIDDPATPIQLYRIAQEAISNAIRHGQARNIYIDLVEVDGRLILTIEDDGSGIGEGPQSVGLGLRTMRHRARMIGATLAIEPADGSGTIVTCKLAPAAGPAPLALPDKSDHD